MGSEQGLTGSEQWEQGLTGSEQKVRVLRGLTEAQRLSSDTNHPPEFSRGAGEEQVSREPEAHVMLSYQPSYLFHYQANT